MSTISQPIKSGRKERQNLAEKVVEYLTREILADRLRPNQRISELAVCRKLGISRSPVREALRILAEAVE
jgi:DNA-binding GntR family transcriptional regulator